MKYIIINSSSGSDAYIAVRLDDGTYKKIGKLFNLDYVYEIAEDLNNGKA